MHKLLKAFLLVSMFLAASCDTFDVTAGSSPTAAPAAKVYEVTVGQVAVSSGGRSAAPAPSKDAFGAGHDGLVLYGNYDRPTELRYPCKDMPEGDYYIGLQVVSPGNTYFGIGESAFHPLEVHHNDTRLLWDTYTEPLPMGNPAPKTAYAAEIRTGKPVRVRPGDMIRVAYAANNVLTVGSLRLYCPKPSGGVTELAAPWNGARSRMLYADWKEPSRTPALISQTCVLTNPGVQPHTYKVQAQARDYYMVPLMPDVEETVTLQPGQSVTKTWQFKPSLTGRDRLTLTATSPGMYADLRAAKFYVRDRAWGPRPNTCLSGPYWEFCYKNAAEPGKTPPANATWTKISVPSLQPNKEVKKDGDKETKTDHHCAWYRRKFTAPNIQGERIILKCEQVLSEAWFYVNGKLVGHELHGAQPFEVDITDGYKPGQENELVIAVRDWLAYSPKNVERAKKGEALVVRQDLVDLATYASTDHIGIGKPMWLEARPAVSVEDVFVVPSVREKKLTLKYRLVNKSAAHQQVVVSPSVLDQGSPIELFTPQATAIGAGQTAELTFSAKWDKPHYWSPQDPYLYCLQTKIQPSGGAADVHQERFGFREIWIDGHSWVINGTRVKLRGSYTNSGNCCDYYPGHPFWTTWQPELRLEQYWNGQTEQLHNYGMDVSRTVYNETCDMGDEVGLMHKKGTEFAGFCQPSFTFDNRFWQGGLETNLRQMKVAKNHPSVIYWEAGNEVMWMHIYLGEVPKAFTSRWQLKISQAMRDFDLQKRPIDWDADSDLFGKWETHSLHYPRELSVYPDIPQSAWWGPWDGKTPADYMFGPITLGKKPVTVGESFWLTPSLPYQPTILVGDQAYAGGDQLGRAWYDITRYFINGYRDAEFAYMDTQPLLPPQAYPQFRSQVLVLKQESSEFYGGADLVRQINIHNDVDHAARLTVRWSLTADDGRAMIGPRTRSFTMAPAELKRWELDLHVPRVNAPVGATWKVELLDGDKLVHVDERHWRIFPAFVAQPPSAVSLFDPSGQTAKEMNRIGLKHNRISDLNKLSGTGLVIGKDAFKQAIQGAWRESLDAFVKGGGKVLILQQDEAPDFLPINLQLAKTKKSTIAFVRAGDHPAVEGMDDEDMRWWESSRPGGADEHYVAYGSYTKPTRGRFLPLVDIGTEDGMTQAPLMELYQGKGSYVLCQMPIVEKAQTAPPAGWMLKNLLGYLDSSSCFRTAGRTALLAGAQSPLRAALADNRLEFVDLTNKPGELKREKFEVAIVDVATALDDSMVNVLSEFAKAGGHVFLNQGSPKQQALLEKLMGCKLLFSDIANEPLDIQNRTLRRTNEGLLSGISNHELFWIGPKYLGLLRIEGRGGSSYDGGCPLNERIADYFVWMEDESHPLNGQTLTWTQRLTRPGTLVKTSDIRSMLGDGDIDAHIHTVTPKTMQLHVVNTTRNEGSIVLSQLRLDQSIPETKLVIERLRSLLLTNLGCDMKGDGDAKQARLRRLAAYQFTPIDLGPYANRGLKDDKAAGIVGPFNQGDNDYSQLPVGRQTFAGIPFLISTPKSVITLYSAQAGNTDLPKAVKGIKVGQKVDALFFLHTMAWGSKEPFKYLVHYEDGTTQEIPIVLEQQAFGWWCNPDEKGLSDTMAKFGCFAAWRGTNPMVKAQGRWGIMLPGYEWPNPHPEKAIKEIDFLTTPDGQNENVPMLAAITAATMQADEGVVTDVIDTRGVKVKLGTQEKEIYYIGVGGIEKTHWYHEQAVAAHKAMVVGQKVKIVYDAVRQNPAGQTIAYVYLGEAQAGNLANGKVIANGLGKLGEFEGNNRLRMYLINLGEPAKWRKVGMWGEKK